MKTHVLMFGVALAVTCFRAPANAQWAVVDVGAIEQLTHQVRQTAQQIQVAQSQYNHLQRMATRAVGLWRYRSPRNVFEAITYADQYASVARWAVGANSGQGAEQGYAATAVVARADDFLGKLNAGMASSRRAMYSTQAIMDGNNVAAIKAVGQIRAAAAQYENAIKALEDDAHKDDELTQSELAVQQRTSNAQIVQLRQTQDTNKLLAGMLDQLTIENKLQRDVIADAANASIGDLEVQEQFRYLNSNIDHSWMNHSLWK